MPRLLLTLPLALVFTAVARPTRRRTCATGPSRRPPRTRPTSEVQGVHPEGQGHLPARPGTGGRHVRAGGRLSGKLKVSWAFGSGDTKTAVAVCAFRRSGLDPRDQSGSPTRDMTVEELNDLRTDTYGVFASTLLTLTETETNWRAGRAVEGRGRTGSSALKLSPAGRPRGDAVFDERPTCCGRCPTGRGRMASSWRRRWCSAAHKEVGGLMPPTTQSTSAQGKEVYNLTEMQFTFPGPARP